MAKKRPSLNEKTSVSSTDTNFSNTDAYNTFTLVTEKLTKENLRINKSLKTSNDNLEVTKNELWIVKDDFEKYKSDVTKILSSLQETQNRAIETIGIFAALLAFVAFEAQLFKGPLSTASLVGISAIMFGTLTTFVLFLDLAFDAFKQKPKLRIFLSGLAIICIGTGFYFAAEGYKNNDNNEYWTKEQVTTEFLKENVRTNEKISNLENKLDTFITSNELLEFKNCILKKGLYQCL